MKIVSILLLGAFLQVSAGGFGQMVSLNVKNAPLEKVFTDIKDQTGLSIIWDQPLLISSVPVTVNFKNMHITDALDLCLKNQSLQYKLIGKMVVISKKAVPTADNTDGLEKMIDFPVTGRIVDHNGRPLEGVSVQVKGSKKGVTTNANGEYQLQVTKENEILIFSFVGFEAQELVVKGRRTINVQMQPAITDLGAVEISTGMFNRKKESFTGATASFSGRELLTIGNNNVLQSLKTLDPSFIILDNVQFGSDPNKLPNIEIRGRSSFTSEELTNSYNSNPNLPLFVLDGFESNLQTISDLNIHRIARITLLKDAASTAIYGSRAANGVVVVETIQPKSGKIEVSYSTDLIVNAPFLNDYNLMNGAEKLEFERLSGQFNSGGFLNSAMITEADYYNRLSDVKSGVNTYWLSEPLRTGFTNGHNININGGSNELRFDAGLSYKQDQGVMKGSGRDTWRGSVILTYRKNKLNVTNQLFVNGYKSKESPYGAFSNFSRATPYYKKRDELGNVIEYLNIFHDPKLAIGFGNDSIANPLYVASLGNRNNSKSLGVTNNIQANYDFTSSLRLSAAFSVSTNTIEQIVFKPSENPEFNGRIPEEKGFYSNLNTKGSSYQGNVMLTYAKVIANVHQLSANVRAEVQESKSDATGFSATGFATLSTGNPNLASGYTPNGRPDASVNLTRRNNLLASVNYMYDTRYLFDFAYRYDGSTAFGSAKRYSPFWSAGIGWNLHHEKGFAGVKWLDLLKLRVNIGYTGNQQFDQTLSVNVYQQLAGQTIFGEMADLMSLGNPNLEWQRTQNLSVGVDYGLMNNRLNGYVNVYRNRSSPLIVPISQAPSSGVSNYSENVGQLTYKGIEGKAAYAIIYKPQNRFVWNVSVTMAHNKGTYSGFEGKLNNLNEAQRQANSYTRYLDGKSPEDIWAVRSAGIDPLTGKELFIKKDGSLSFIYDANDEVVLGNTRPEFEGVFGSNLSYKGFTVGVYLRYSYAGDIMNNALYSKVENLTGSYIRRNNLDKRALYDRWKNPGDIAAFKSITDQSYTPISSRFVQRDNFLSGESITIGYRFTNMDMLKQMGLKGLNISAYTNNIFRLSTIKNERGIDYPFASSVSININATF